MGSEKGGEGCKVCLQTAEFAPSTSTPLCAGTVAMVVVAGRKWTNSKAKHCIGQI